MALIQTPLAGFEHLVVTYGRCSRCGRVLTDPVSVQRGMGDVCAAKSGMNSGENKVMIADRFIDDVPFTKAVVMRRTPDGVLATNVPHHVTHHSPSGYEVSYSGSGPADIALNIVEHALRLIHYNGATMATWDGRRCFKLAWDMHQDFKAAWIATLNPDADEWQISYELVEKLVRNFIQIREEEDNDSWT